LAVAEEVLVVFSVRLGAVMMLTMGLEASGDEILVGTLGVHPQAACVSASC